ncbi:hypothetical protein C2G38_2138776 [Gigaspora rosea]|uniref:Uncharacterized protein n=1 Tax=Gigaspora rosea TaxID=44941 RepID=A0A397VU04_9GLOM|nr:hypothetical protein C2G38_2138776 [Gigaspora rosea]
MPKKMTRSKTLKKKQNASKASSSNVVNEQESPIVVNKVLDYRYVNGVDVYLQQYQVDEQIKINWMKYESMVGCDDLIRDYWLRERSINPLASPSGSSRILVGSGWYKFRYESDCDQPNNSMDFIDDFTQTNVTLTNMMRDVENVLSNEMSTENVETTLPNTNVKTNKRKKAADFMTITSTSNHSNNNNNNREISANNLNDAGLKPNTINKLDSLSKEVNNLDNEIIEQSIKPNKKSKFTNDELEQNNFSSINNSASINDKVNNSASINKVNNNSSSTDKVNNNSISTDKVNNNNSVSTEKANNNNNSLSIAIDNDDLSEKTRGKTISINISTKDHASGFIPKIFSATHTQIYKEQELISSKKSLDAQLTDIGVTKNTGINDAQHQANMEWKGSLIKGSLVQFIATVILKPLPGHCPDFSLFNEISNRQNLRIEHCIRLSDAMKIVTPNALGFITEPANILKSKYNMRKEYMFMKENNIVGVIWLNKDKQRCLLAFAISNEICRFLQLRHKPNVPLILLEKTLLSQPSSSETSKYQKLFPRQMLDNNLDLQICEIYLNYMEYFRLLEICKNPGVKILLFVPDPKQVTVEGGQVIMKENLEVVEMEHALNCLGAVCVNTYSDDIQYVLIHYLFEKQIYWIPNLIKLKRLPNCKFVGFGTNPNNIKFWNLDEFFKQGGFVTATAPLFVKGENVVFRILTVMNHQKQLYKDASWEFLLSKNVLDALDRCCRLRSINSHNARLAYYSLIAKINMKKIRYFNPDEIFKYNNSTDSPPSFLLSLHRIMMRVHSQQWKKYRHFIVLYDESEDLSQDLPIEGVELMTLREFEKDFGL